MGMLALAGAVSGGGKALQQAASQTQSMLSQMQLLEIRDQMERARMKETWGHEEGMLSKRHALDLERDDRAHSRALDLEDQRQDFQTQRDRMGRTWDRERDATTFDRQKEVEEIKRQNRISELIVEKGFSQQEAARKVQEEEAAEKRKEQAKIREESRSERRDQRKFQAETGRDIVLESMRGQRPGSGTGTAKLDGETNARLKVLTDEIASEEKKLDNLALREDDRKKIQRRIDQLQAERRSLIGMASPRNERPAYRLP